MTDNELVSNLVNSVQTLIGEVFSHLDRDAFEEYLIPVETLIGIHNGNIQGDNSMSLQNGFSGISESDIRSLSHEDLVQAVLRMTSVNSVRAEDWVGSVYPCGHPADAFRSNQ